MTEGTFPKINGDATYASEVNGFNNGVVGFTKGNNFDWVFSGARAYNELDNTYCEVFSGDTAGSTTNLTHNTAVDEYFSVADGAYELITDSYKTESNCTKCYVWFDYALYKELNETDTTSTQSGGDGTDTDNVYDIKSEKVVTIKYGINIENGADTSTDMYARIRLYDGSNSSSLLAISNTSAHNEYDYSINGVMKIYHDSTAKLFKFQNTYETIFSEETSGGDNYGTYYRLTNSMGEIDYTAWGSPANIYLQTYAQLANYDTDGSATATVYYARAYKQNPSSTVVVSVSSDGGSNYYTVSNGSVITVPSGSDFKAKITGTLAASEGITIKRVIIKPLA